MRLIHIAATTAAVLATIAATPTPAHAELAISVPFAATSGDDCRYGFTEGTLTWRFGTSPLPVRAVAVKGRVADRPLPADPAVPCRDDGLFSVATFTAFLADRAVDRDARRADNGVTSFEFVLGADSTVSAIDRVVVQVCRHRPSSTVPAYCGRAVDYRIPPVATP